MIINGQISTFLINVRLFILCLSKFLTHMVFSQYSISNVSLSTILSLKRKLLCHCLHSSTGHLISTIYGESFRYKKVGHALRTKCFWYHCWVVNYEGSTRGSIYVHCIIFLCVTYFMRDTPQLTQNLKVIGVQVLSYYKCLSLNFSNLCETFSQFVSQSS